MIERKDLEKYIEHYPGEKEHLVQLIDKINRVKKTWEDAVTDFLTPDEQYMLKKICDDTGVNVYFFGGKGDYERAVAVMCCGEHDIEFPIDIIKITGNFKFEKLDHRDYLGAILSLGIKREKVGDINVYEDGAEIYIQKDISDYICFNLNKIKHTGIKVEKINFDKTREKIQRYKETLINIASLRLDCVVSAAAGFSRSEASSLIKNGDVKLNFIVLTDSSCKVKEEDLLSIKGYGRFLIGNIKGTTKKDRIVLSIKKFL